MSCNQEKLRSIEEIPRTTITSYLANRNSDKVNPNQATESLFPKVQRHVRPQIDIEFFQHEITDDELNRAVQYGNFPHRPSDLFLKLFHNALITVRRDPMAGRLSPSLMGSSGVVPFTIISTIPDIMQHYFRCIVNAEKEVLLATNFWQVSNSSDMITKSLRELSRRAVRDGRKIIVKFIIDHPTKENLFNYHTILPESKWSEYGIPSSSDLENVSLEINNYHRLIFGTFHAKFLVVDRRISLMSSNNIQDRPNLEMMSHFEGDIVNAFYDTFIVSWSLPFRPNLVCLNEQTEPDDNFQFGINNEKIFPLKTPLKEIIGRARLRLFHHCQENFSNIYFDLNDENQSCPMKQVRKTSSENFLPNLASKVLAEHRENHSAGVLMKATANLMAGTMGFDANPPRVPTLTKRLNESAETARSTRPDQNFSADELDRLAFDFSPFIFHEKHSPVPMAMVSRGPYGKPIHKDVANPQDAAWIGAFRYATKSIFIQSPTLNAAPAVDGVLSACRRGVLVTLWLGLGFNDSKEGTGTFQGGTNEQVVKKLYQHLRDGQDGAENFLKVYWYTGKDQSRPLNFSQRKRNCHIKFMAIDDQVAIIGSGNMDSQSWFHSQEINVMIDSATIVKEFTEALYKNQATAQFGLVSTDGIWRDADGNLNPNNGK